MSGGNCPETPRQKMIGMMYLFLTAMLALNVSGDLLKAFQLVDESIKHTIVTVENKNSALYRQFGKSLSDNEEKVRDKYDAAQKIRIAADSLAKHIDELKLLIVHTVDGPEATIENYTAIDNQDVAAQVMITEKRGARSIELKEQIGTYKELLLSYIDVNDSIFRNSIKTTLQTNDPPSKDGEPAKSWEGEKFEHIPLSASFALMSKMRSDVRNTEADVVRYLFAKIDESSFKFSTIEPLVIPKSETVIRGGEYYAEIMVAARDETMDPRVKVNGVEVMVDEQGKGIYKVAASSIGKKTWTGVIEVLGPTGLWQPYPVKGEYEVIEPMVVISPTKMNVFYEGVVNPVSISVPGVSSKDIKASITNGRIVPRGNSFDVTVNQGTAGGKAIINVVAQIDGKSRSMGNMEFRIKRIPPPIAKVAGKNEGKIAKGLLIAQSGIFAEMEDFDFELEYNVTRFVVSTLKNGYIVDEPSTNNRFTDAQKLLINGCQRGTKVFISDIKAVGPDKVTKNLGSITITID